jgi:hypothetical protein
MPESLFELLRLVLSGLDRSKIVDTITFINFDMRRR